MSDYGNILKGLAVRLVLSAPLFGVGWYLLHTGATPAHSVMFSLPLFLVGALIVGPKLCELLAEPWRSFFYPSKHFDGPQPMYSIPASKRAKGDYEGAIAAYEDIAEKHPKERKPYEGMIDIAVVNLKDRDAQKAGGPGGPDRILPGHDHPPRRRTAVAPAAP